MPFPSPTIYAITDAALSGLSHAVQVERLLAAGARLIQLRAKELEPAALEPVARRCADLCRAAGATLIVNDHADVAMLAGAAGVHVGQDDMDVLRARQIVGPGRIVGVSTHDRAQFLRALELPVDYIAVGPIFGTTTKANPDPATGVAFAEWASRELAGRKPLVAIGGIDERRMEELLRSAPDVTPAVIGAIAKARDIGSAWRSLEQTRQRVRAGLFR